ncbi:MAG: hypothetical protein II712_01075 [Erysipelotrichaceae bacterium]|nr:hypothetical protein [Erysipelotrichaceae bacterium]
MDNEEKVMEPEEKGPETQEPETQEPETQELQKPRKKSKLLLIVLALLLVGAIGGYVYYINTEGYKIGKMDKQAQQLIAAKDYEGVVILYRNSLDEGRDKDQVLDRVRSFYDSRFETIAANSKSLLGDLLGVWDDMSTRFPEFVDYSESQISDLLVKTIDVVGGFNLDKLESLYQGAIKRYFASDKICKDVDDIFRKRVRQVIELDLQNDVLINQIKKNDFDGIFTQLDRMNLRGECKTAVKYTSFPVIVNITDETIIGAYFVNGSLVLYYGGADMTGKRSGRGTHIAYIVDSSDSSRYIRQVVQGEFHSDMLTGHFTETTVKHISSSSERIGIMEGEMIDNRYHGTITGKVSDGSGQKEDYVYTFEFDNGKAVRQSSYEKNGKTYYVVATGTFEGGSSTYAFGEETVDLERGLTPFYRDLW